MNDQHNINNNQNTYRNNERSDSFGSNAHFGEPNTRVLSGKLSGAFASFTT